MSAEIHSGGCQCGAVRFRLTGAPGTSSVCYCRMCQKASASHALALVSVGEAGMEWTRAALVVPELECGAARILREVRHAAGL